LIGKLDRDALLGLVEDLPGGGGIARLNVLDAEDAH
jgi:hypothetical protein